LTRTIVPLLRVIILSGADQQPLARLLGRLKREIPDVTVCGVLYELPRPPRRLRRRLTNLLTNLQDREYVSYLAAITLEILLAQLTRMGHRLLRLAHGWPRLPERETPSEDEELSRACYSIRCPLHMTADVHSPAALDFVRKIRPDLGVVWGTRILKPELFNLPRLGSINIHRKKLPEYRGSGPAGLWELLDGQREVGITIHRVEAALDAGAVLAATSVAIEPFDSLVTLDRKTYVAGNDLLVRVLDRMARGDVESRPQHGIPREFRRAAPHHFRRYARQIAAGRPRCRATRRNSILALLLRTALCMPRVFVRNWIRRVRGAYPIVVVRYSISDDRESGLPLHLLLKHLDFLKRHYCIASLDEVIGLLRSGRVTMPTVALIFDGRFDDEALTLRAALSEADDHAALACDTFERQIVASKADVASAVRLPRTRYVEDVWELELLLQECLSA
jgi:hypothetical protein